MVIAKTRKYLCTCNNYIVYAIAAFVWYLIAHHEEWPNTDVRFLADGNAIGENCEREAFTRMI